MNPGFDLIDLLRRWGTEALREPFVLSIIQTFRQSRVRLADRR